MEVSHFFTKHKPWLFFLILVPLYLTWTFDHSLWNPDETRDAGIAAEMFRGGDFVVPKLNGDAFLEKPPLYYWTSAVIYKLTGSVTAGTTRLPSALYGILGVLFTFLIGKHLFNERVGLFAASLLATTTQYFRMSHFALMDVALAALVTGALYFHLKGSKFGFLVFTILAFYAKGFLGIILPGLVVTLHLLLERKPKQLAITIGLGAGLFALFVFPWFWGLWKAGGRRFLEIFLIDNHWERFFSKTADHTEHFWFFYLLSFPVDFLPWTVLYLGHLRDIFKHPQKYFESKEFRFVLLWLSGLFLFFTLSSSKRSIYLLPLFPAASILSAAWLNDVISRRPNENTLEKRIYGTFGAIALLIGLSSFSLASRLDRDKSFVPVCDAVRETKCNVVIGYNLNEMERGVFGFYLQGPLENPTNPDHLNQLLVENQLNSFCLVVNRNKIDEVRGSVEKWTRVVYEHRPDKRTRSYLVYVNAKEFEN